MFEMILKNFDHILDIKVTSDISKYVYNGKNKMKMMYVNENFFYEIHRSGIVCQYELYLCPHKNKS